MVGTGEHGVGIGKRKYLVEELGEGTVRLMKTIKDSIDPLNLLNPGKVGLSLLLENLFVLIDMAALSRVACKIRCVQRVPRAVDIEEISGR